MDEDETRPLRGQDPGRTDARSTASAQTKTPAPPPAAAAAASAPSAAAAAAAAAAAVVAFSPSIADAAAIAAIEPEERSVPCWDRSVSGFGAFFDAVVRAGRQETTLELPNFALLGHDWNLNTYRGMPSVCFRIVAFHRDVVAETDRLNAPILKQRQEAAQRAAEEEAEESGQPVGPPSAAAVESAARWFPLLDYPANDPRNAEVVQKQPRRFNINEDHGFNNWIDHKDIDDYLCGPERTLHFRVLMQTESWTRSDSAHTRSLNSFIPDRNVTANPLTVPQLQWPYLGLNNQGATCYLASYVQALFYLPEFRRAVFDIPVDAQEMLDLIESASVSERVSEPPAAAVAYGWSSARSPSLADIKINPTLALQNLFFHLQTGTAAAEMRPLTKSIDWNPTSLLQQHDVQEFSRFLLDALNESVVKQQPPMPAITRLFEGKQQTYVKCQNVSFTSTRVESFRGLSLSVKNAGTLQRSLDQYVAEELMQGSNQYRAVDKDKGVDFGMQDARKGVRFLRFPQVLQIHLQRFEAKEAAARSLHKNHDRFEFPLTLDLRHLEWGDRLEAGQQAGPADPSRPSTRPPPAVQLDPPIYQLHSVLVHEGRADSGCYRVFIRPFLADPAIAYDDSPWFEFDDETVSIRADATAVQEGAFGGGYEQSFTCLGRPMMRKVPGRGKAVRLVYVRRQMAAAKGFYPDQASDATSPGPHAASRSSSRTTSAAAAAESKEEVEAGDGSLSAPMDLTGDATPAGSAAAASAASSIGGPACRCLTSNPPDLHAFIESLSPVAVPLPHHLSAGLEEARRVRREREKRESELTSQLPLDIVVESDLVWQGFGHGAGRGGVAGLGLTVAPAIDPSDPQPLALRDFLFAAPHKQHAFKYSDTVGSVRARLAAEAGLPLERAQLWRVHRKPPAGANGVEQRFQQCDYLHSDKKWLGSLVRSRWLVAQNPLLLLLRDRLAIDQDEVLSKIFANSGAVEGAHRSLDPSLSGGAGQNERVMLFFKYFDVHSQRMVMLGSAILWKHMSVQHLKQFLMALLRSRAIDIESRTRMPAPVVVERFEQLHRGSAAAGAPALKKEETASDVDMAPAVGSSQLPFLSHMHRLGAGVTFCQGSPAYSGEDGDVDDFVEPKVSYDELRFDQWSRTRTAPIGPAEPGSLALRLVLEAECVATTMSEALEDWAKDPALAKAQRLQEDARTLGECGLINGSVIIVESQASARELLQARSAHASACARDDPRPAMVLAPAASSSSSPTSHAPAAADAVGSVGSSSSVPAAASAAAASGPALLPSPLPSELLVPLPAHAAFYPDARSYLKYLLHRWLASFTPAVLDPVTLERSPLDPIASPLHPAAALGPAVMEVSTAWTLEHMRSQLAQRVSTLVSPAVRASYPQVSKAHCYKLWKPSRHFPGTLEVEDGEIALTMPWVSPPSVAFALVDQPVDRLGPLEQLVRNHSTTRSAVQTLYFELSAVSLRKLEDNWWLQLELVDERGEVHRMPAANPGLWPEQPFLVPKSTDFLLRGLRQTIYDQFIVAHRATLPFAHYALLGADGQPLPPLPPAFADSAMGISVKSEQPSSASKRRAEAAVASEQPASKKLKNEEPPASIGEAAQDGEASSVAAAPPVSVRVGDLLLHVYVPNAAPLVVSRLSDPPKAMANFLLPWANWTGCSVSSAALGQLRAWFERARTDTPKGSHVRHPTKYANKNLEAAQYTQPLPFRLTCHLQPSPSAGDEQFDAFVFRFTNLHAFTADQSLPRHLIYALSPLPPILAVGDRRDDAHGVVFRRRLAAQLGKPFEEVKLALLRPREYEMIPDGPTGMGGVYLSSSRPLFSGWVQDPQEQLGLYESPIRLGSQGVLPLLPSVVDPSIAAPFPCQDAATGVDAGAVTSTDPVDEVARLESSMAAVFAVYREAPQLRQQLQDARAEIDAAQLQLQQARAQQAEQSAQYEAALRLVRTQLSEHKAQLDQAAAELQAAKQCARGN